MCMDIGQLRESGREAFFASYALRYDGHPPTGAGNSSVIDSRFSGRVRDVVRFSSAFPLRIKTAFLSFSAQTRKGSPL